MYTPRGRCKRGDVREGANVRSRSVAILADLLDTLMRWDSLVSSSEPAITTFHWTPAVFRRRQILVQLSVSKQAAAVLTAKGCIAAATHRITLASAEYSL